MKSLKKLDDELGISLSPPHEKTKEEIRKEAKKKERKTLLSEIWQAWPRRTVLSRDVLQMRSNALKNPEVKAILKKTDSRIEDCALVNLMFERHIGEERDCPAYCSLENIRMALTDEKWSFANRWRALNNYEWGSPKDPIKILFQQSANNRFKMVGITQMFKRKENRPLR